MLEERILEILQSKIAKEVKALDAKHVKPNKIYYNKNTNQKLFN